MGTGYARVSATNMADGNVAYAAHFNDEFNAILASFNATTGHAHNGSNGEGPLINLSTSITGVLGASNGGITATNADPTPANSGASYAEGSLWLNTSNHAVFVCGSNGAATAVWNRLLGVSVSGSNPGTGDDITKGYNPGSVWVKTGDNGVFVCKANTSGAASWLRVSGTGTAASNPSTSDDSTAGYQVGSVWVNRNTNDVYICASNTAASASWINLNGNLNINSLTATNPAPSDEIVFYDVSASANRKVAVYGLVKDGGDKASNFTAETNTFYNVTGSNVIITGPASANSRDVLALCLGEFGKTFEFNPNSLKVNGSTSSVFLDGGQTINMTYNNATNGWA